MTNRSAEPGQRASDEAERLLLRRERFGMRFGLDRIHRLLNVLGLARIPFPSIEIVGTNGKSSTTRLTTALLERHGLRTGCFTSPHLLSYRERIRVGEADIAPERFAATVAQVVRAADLVDRSQTDADDRVTQFELLTAAALVEFAAAQVDVAVLEAGLGGRYDATNAVDSGVAVLTNVGLEHTRYLGPTVADIAREKLAVVRPGSTLIIGPAIDPVAREIALRTAAERGATLVEVEDEPSADFELAARGAYQRGNFAVARAAAQAFLGRELDPAAVLAAAHSVSVPGRFEVHDGQPQVLFDGAHNPGGIDALTASLPEFVAGRRLVAVVSILDDKDAAAMLRGLLAHVDALVCTACASPRALPAPTLASLAGQLGAAEVVIEQRPHDAMVKAGELAGPDGVVLATGSIYLLADLMRDAGAAPGSTL
ncbi:MAG: cyanophycin synthetase [Solirubrobacteraceae bacterium]|jgi:dihydrofolate synthase/folylpolyglutamate synthase